MPYEAGTTLRDKIGKKVEVVDNIAALQLLATSTIEEKYVYTLGYSNPNDGGGNLYYLDATSTATEDLKLVFNPDNLANGRWIAQDTSKHISADRGDANYTIVIGDYGIQLFETTLTANRTVTLPTTGLYRGLTYTVVRMDVAAYTLDVGGIKTIPSEEAAAVTIVYNGVAWKLIDYSVITAAPVSGFISLLQAWPVGSIYATTSAANPSTLFGGTWAATAVGRFPLGAGTSDASYVTGSTGGASTHQLIANEMPTHNHTYIDISENVAPFTYDTVSGSPYNKYNNAQTTGDTGGDAPHNNLPPYEVFYYWKRTA